MKLSIIIDAVLDPLKTKLGQATGMIGKLGQGMRTTLGALGSGLATAFTIGGLTSIAKEIAGIGEEARKMNIGTDEFQKLSFAAEQTGSDVGSVGVAMKKLSSMLDDAITKGGSAAETFKRLGLDLNALSEMNAYDQFVAVSDALRKMGSTSEQTALALDLFGRSATQLLPMIDEFSTLAEQFDKSGMKIENRTIKMADALDDMVKRAAQAWKADAFKGIMLIKDAVSGDLFSDPTNKKVQAGEKKQKDDKDEKEYIAGVQRRRAELDKLAKAETDRNRNNYDKKQSKLADEAQKAEQKNTDAIWEAKSELNDSIELQKLKNAGLDREYAIRSKILSLEGKGVILSPEDEKIISDLAGKEFDMQKGKDFKMPNIAPVATDAMLRVGAMQGTDTTRQTSIQQRQINELIKIANNTNKIANKNLEEWE